MKLTAEREKLLTPLQAVIGVVERRQTMPVLANVLLGIRKGQLTIAATDLEVELVAGTDVAVQDLNDAAADVFAILLDICNQLDLDLEKAFIAREHKNQSRTWQ